MTVKLVQLLNEYAPIVNKESGKLISSSPLQPSNECSPRLVNDAKSSKVEREEQPAKVYEPMVSTLASPSTSVNTEQL